MALGVMPCFLHAAYTPPALDFFGSGCVVSAVALRLSGGALAARMHLCVRWGPSRSRWWHRCRLYRCLSLLWLCGNVLDQVDGWH
eukprot:6468841-Amphidinium_carterae.1